MRIAAAWRRTPEASVKQPEIINFGKDEIACFEFPWL